MDRSATKGFFEALISVYEGAHITGDSRKVCDGDIYLAHVGSNFVVSAAASGAVCILVDGNNFHDAQLRTQLPDHRFITVDDFIRDRIRRKCVIPYQSYRDALIGIITHRYSNLPKKIAAVTGTQGKTSVVSFVMQLCGLLQQKCISIGTLGAIDSSGKIYHDDRVPLTTMALWDLYRTLDSAGAMDVQLAVIEASSHGIVQGRIANLPIDVGAFTNLGLDHLDYHKTIEGYFATKKLLFSEYLQPRSLAVLNGDVPEYLPLMETCATRNIQMLDYGQHADKLRLLAVNVCPAGQKISILYQGVEHSFVTSMIAEFQVMNIICAIGVMLGFGYDPAEIVRHITNLAPPQGRLQEVLHNQLKTGIYIDFAHTPQALLQVLSSIIGHFRKSVILVIGCGGDRDVTKRSVMGWIAAHYCAYIIITDDNPRTEAPELIRDQILSGVKDYLNGNDVSFEIALDLKLSPRTSSACKYAEIGDRKLAIEHAVSLKTDNEIVLIAGKGHERYQIVHDKLLPFDDYTVALSAYMSSDRGTVRGAT